MSATGTVSGWHYYIQDYMGNVRMVVNKNGTTEQVTHYYPYGGMIGDISTNQSLQKFKFEGKELDRTFGLDWYDIQARQYDAIGVPSWNKVDPLAEKYYGISPYVYCGGNPVNRGDYNGYDWISASYGDQTFYCWDPEIHCTSQIGEKYYYGDYMNGDQYYIKYLGESLDLDYNGKKLMLNANGSFSYNGGEVTSEELEEDGLHVGSVPDNYSFGKNLYGVYLGGSNPTRNKNVKDVPSYCIPPIDPTDYAAYCHDKGYDSVSASGPTDALFRCRTRYYDAQLAVDCDNALSSIKDIKYYGNWKANAYVWNRGASALFGGLSKEKTIMYWIFHL